MGVPCCNGECTYNAGVQWAYYVNPDQLPNEDDGNYESFDPTLLKDIKPVYQNTTTSIGLLSHAEPIHIYNSPQTFNSRYLALNHRGYIHAIQGGNYTFTSYMGDEIVLYWLGEHAYSGWTRANAVLEDAAPGPDPRPAVTYSAELQQGQYYALRLVYANAQSIAREATNVTAPDGTVILGMNSVPNPYVVQDSCDGNAPAYPPFGQEG